ncbi:hypothetical protein AAVH_15383 [Aphelenchoides avenae]|nr:hypothetical protein AAVH_15383 [Aphelenchus avenae]
MEVSDTDSSSDNPAAAKRPKLGSPEDDDEDISIIEEHIDVCPRQAADGTSPTAGPSQLTDGEGGENNQDSKIAVFRNKMLEYEAEASHLRTQLKREQEKAQNAEREKASAEGVKLYLEEKCDEERKRANKAEAVAQQKVAVAEKKAKDLQKECERVETKVQSKEAEIEYRDKQIANAAKELNEAKKKAEDALKEAAEARKKVTDAEQREAGANAKAAEADTKRKVAETEASDLKQKLEEMKKNKTAEERKLNAKITELENRLAGTENAQQPSSSTDAQRPEGLNGANKRSGPPGNDIAKLHADKDMLKKDLKASRAKATRLENAGKKAVDEILSLKERIVVLENELNGPADPVLDARLRTTRLQQAIGRFAGIADKVMMKYDNGGVSIKSDPSRPTLPRVLLELKPSFFDEYDCRKECLAQIDYSLLSQGSASQSDKEQCRIHKKFGRVMRIDFKSADEEGYNPGLTLAVIRGSAMDWTLIEDNAPYACTFEMNSFVLAQAARELGPVLLDFNNRDGPDAVAITDSENRMGGGQRECLWRSLAGDNPHVNDFKAEFSSTTPDTHLRIFVDPKYLRRCVMASSGSGSKTVEVSMSEDTLRLRYGNEHFSLTYYIPTVKPAENGERSYSPIEFGHETFEI